MQHCSISPYATSWQHGLIQILLYQYHHLLAERYRDRGCIDLALTTEGSAQKTSYFPWPN
jgi:hypothetical protein